MKNIILSILILLLGSTVYSQSDLEKFEKANKAYENNEYNNAIELYSELIEASYLSDDLHYNLANAYFRTNQLALAILHYEKAIKIDPSNEDAKHNLEYANSKTIDKIENIPDLFFYRWWEAIIHSFSSTSWAYFVILFLFLGVAGLGIYFFFSEVVIKRAAFYSGISSLIIGVICWIIAGSLNSSLNKVDAGIIMSPTVDIISSPSEGSSRLFVLHEGSKVSIEEKSGEWYEVKLPNGNSGWVKSSDLEVI